MWHEYFIYGINKNLSSGNGTVFEQGAIKTDSDADFSWEKTVYWATNGNIRIKFRDESLGRYFVKTQADLRAIAGSFVGTPFIWPRPYIIPAGTNFTVEAADAAGAGTNTLRLALHGAKIRPGNPPWGTYDPKTGKIVWKRYRALVPFIYSTELQSVSANSTVSLRIEVDNDAHFLVQKITGSKLGNATVSVKEGARDRDWSNIAVHFDCLVGNGQFPNILFSNRFIYRGSVIMIQVTDLSGVDNVIEVNLIGLKLYE